jgi:hypothetical protein
MTIAKASALTAGFIGAVALGVVIGPSITHRAAPETVAPPVAAVEPAPEVPMRPLDSPRVTAEKKAVTTARVNMAAMSTSAPELHERLRPVLNRGTRMELAAEGFRDAEQFATVAHASHNTQVPFAILKHRVLEQGQSLVEAIHETKPDANAQTEAARARSAARADLAAIAG